MLGFFNSALPFFLFAYVAQTISAALLCILNATAPIWAAAIAAIWQRADLTRAKVLGRAMGLAVLTLGVVCSGVAYLIYFRLISEFGVDSALTVTFLIPVFGTLWGAWLLAEPVTPTIVLGGLLVFAGTALATGFSWRTLFGRKCQVGA